MCGHRSRTALRLATAALSVVVFSSACTLRGPLDDRTAPSTTAPATTSTTTRSPGPTGPTGPTGPGSTSSTPSTSTTSSSTTTTTASNPDDGSAVSTCSTYAETTYLPARSFVTFERNGVTVDVKRVASKQLTLEVWSSDGRYDGDWIDPHTPLYEGLLIATSIGFDWVWDHFEAEFVLEPGQVKTVLQVYDCWAYTSGPDDVF